MDKKFLVFALILMLCSSVFATAPTLSPIDWNPKYEADLNYSKWNADFITLSSIVTGEDLNAEDCYWSVDGGDTWTRSTVDMNTDNNIITVSINMPAVTNDVNFGMKCINNAEEESETVIQRIWLDETAPQSGASFTNNILTLVTSDYATTIGNGSGIQSFMYSLDGGEWIDLGSDTQYDIRTSPGNHTVRFCAIDNLDNNECAEDIWEKNFRTMGVQNSACVIIDIIPIILAALILIGILMALKLGVEVTPEIITALVIAAIIGVIAIIVYSSIVAGFCTI